MQNIHKSTIHGIIRSNVLLNLCNLYLFCCPEHCSCMSLASAGFLLDKAAIFSALIK